MANNITLTDAGTDTHRFQNNISGKKAHGFDGSDVQEILSQTGCVDIRIYNGQKSDGSLYFIMVGVDSSGNDIVGVGAKIKFSGNTCPVVCSDANGLN